MGDPRRIRWIRAIQAGPPPPQHLVFLGRIWLPSQIQCHRWGTLAGGTGRAAWAPGWHPWVGQRLPLVPFTPPPPQNTTSTSGETEAQRGRGAPPLWVWGTLSPPECRWGGEPWQKAPLHPNICTLGGMEGPGGPPLYLWGCPTPMGCFIDPGGPHTSRGGPMVCGTLGKG